MRWYSWVAVMGMALAIDGLALAQAPAAPAKNPQIVFETSAGNFTVVLFADKAPIGTANMLAYVKSDFYTGTIFHRVIPGFVIQGGGFDAKFQQKPTRAPIKNEASNGIKNLRGSLSYARTNDPNSATSQFFVNVVDNSALDPVPGDPMHAGYAVFGKVIAGMEVVDAIKDAKIACPSQARAPCPAPVPSGMMDVPAEPVVVKKAYVKG
jgi:peptidyl-prolyl cis-trans isomerase A (cyclophilin A)